MPLAYFGTSRTAAVTPAASTSASGVGAPAGAAGAAAAAAAARWASVGFHAALMKAS